MDPTTYRTLFDAFTRKRILIIGDVMVDVYIWGKVERISPEAPVPIVAVERRENRLGGAANVALNIKAMGSEALLLTMLGHDQKGKEFLELMQQEGLDCRGVIQAETRITTTKFRVIGNKTQLLRVDEEIDDPLTTDETQALQGAFDAILRDTQVDAIIFQDYDKGVITPALIGHVVAGARKMGIPVTVDPKHRNFFEYKHVSLFKPNLKELKEGLKLDEIKEEADLEKAVSMLQERLQARYMLVTRSEKGVYIRYQQDDGQHEQHYLPAVIRHIADVSGAGDTVISVATLCLTIGLGPSEIAALSNRAGGLVCEEVGVVPIDREKLLAELLRG